MDVKIALAFSPMALQQQSCLQPRIRPPHWWRLGLEWDHNGGDVGQESHHIPTSSSFDSCRGWVAKLIIFSFPIKLLQNLTVPQLFVNLLSNSRAWWITIEQELWGWRVLKTESFDWKLKSFFSHQEPQWTQLHTCYNNQMTTHSGWQCQARLGSHHRPCYQLSAHWNEGLTDLE